MADLFFFILFSFCIEILLQAQNDEKIPICIFFIRVI